MPPCLTSKPKAMKTLNLACASVFTKVLGKIGLDLLTSSLLLKDHIFENGVILQ